MYKIFLGLLCSLCMMGSVNADVVSTIDGESDWLPPGSTFEGMLSYKRLSQEVVLDVIEGESNQDIAWRKNGRIRVYDVSDVDDIKEYWYYPVIATVADDQNPPIFEFINGNVGIMKECRGDLGELWYEYNGTEVYFSRVWMGADNGEPEEAGETGFRLILAATAPTYRIKDTNMCFKMETDLELTVAVPIDTDDAGFIFQNDLPMLKERVRSVLRNTMLLPAPDEEALYLDWRSAQTSGILN